MDKSKSLGSNTELAMPKQHDFAKGAGRVTSRRGRDYIMRGLVSPSGIIVAGCEPEPLVEQVRAELREDIKKVRHLPKACLTS